VDANNTVIVSDSRNHRLRKVEAQVTGEGGAGGGGGGGGAGGGVSVAGGRAGGQRGGS
jgi:hypothetical protein